MLVVCVSVSGAPGVSTLAAGLAARWPRQPALLLEADPSGGVAAARFGLGQHPGLASLAAQMRHGASAAVAEHAQLLPVGCAVVAGPGSAETATGAVAVLAQHAEDTLRQLAPVVVADVGRLYVGSPAVPMLVAADVVLVLTEPGTEQLDHLDARMPELRSTVRWGRLAVVLAGKGPYGRAEITERLGVPVLADIPRDRWGGGALAGRLTVRGWARTRLGRAAAELAASLSGEYQHDGADDAGSGHGAGTGELMSEVGA